MRVSLGIVTLLLTGCASSFAAAIAPPAEVLNTALIGAGLVISACLARFARSKS